jgi:hypothetical protein
MIGSAPPLAQAMFSWQRLSRNYFRLSCGSDVRGALSLSPEPSILFSPMRCEFYRATAHAGHRQYSFKCLFRDGEFQGCVATEEGVKQPLALFEERPARHVWRSRSQITLCQDGTTWPWLEASEKGRWIALGKSGQILEVKSRAPENSGSIRVWNSAVLNHRDASALILFSAYLSIGPKRLLPESN